MATVPPQVLGSHSDNAHKIKLSSNVAAETLYQKACLRLFDVNNWTDICNNLLKATFILCDSEGNPVNRHAKQGDFFKIDIPGPGPISGRGYDWVQVEKIEQIGDKNAGIELASLRVRPAACPVNDDIQTAHFLSPLATSTFLVLRNGNVVSAEVHGRNEIPNQDEEIKVVDKVRNTLIAGLAVNGFAVIQWKELCKAFLNDNN